MWNQEMYWIAYRRRLLRNQLVDWELTCDCNYCSEIVEVAEVRFGTWPWI